MLRMSQEGFCRLRMTLTKGGMQMGRKENTSLLPCPNPEGDPQFSQEGSLFNQSFLLSELKWKGPSEEGGA